MTRQTTKLHPPRAARNSLNSNLILDAAEKILATDPSDMSMRDIALEVGATPMALYRHFPNKEELLNSLLDRVLTRFTFESSSDDWAIDLQLFAKSHLQLLLDHPWAIQYLFSRPAPGLGAMRIGEMCFSILHRGKISGTEAVAAFSGIIAMNYGWASFVTTQGKSTINGGNSADLHSFIDHLPSEEFSHTKNLKQDLSQYGDWAHYELALSAFCHGLRHTYFE